MTRRPSLTGLALCLFGLAGPGCVQARAAPHARLDLLWEAPITVETTHDGVRRSQGFDATAIAAGPDGKVAAIGNQLTYLPLSPSRQSWWPVLVLDAGASQPDGVLPMLHLEGRLKPPLLSSWAAIRPLFIREPQVASLALGPDGTVWLGGMAQFSPRYFSQDACSAYLARLDGTGMLLGSRAHRAGGCTTINGIVPLPQGGAVVVGSQDRQRSWLARVGPGGRVLQEHTFGDAWRATVVALPGERFLAVGTISQRSGTDHVAEVATWVLDETLQLRRPMRIRSVTARRSLNSHARLAASTTSDGAYVASSWTGPTQTIPVELARVGLDGAAVWVRGMPSTARAGEDRSGADTCAPALATLPGGDALVACMLADGIHLARFDRETGHSTEDRIAVPSCPQRWASRLSLTVQTDGAVLLAGSGGRGPSCSWMGRLSWTQD